MGRCHETRPCWAVTKVSQGDACDTGESGGLAIRYHRGEREAEGTCVRQSRRNSLAEMIPDRAPALSATKAPSAASRTVRSDVGCITAELHETSRAP